MEVRYATEDNWSRKLLAAKDDSGRRKLDTLVDATLGYLPREFLYAANLAEGEKFERRMGERATRAPNVPHGLNDYAHLHDVAFLSSLNPMPDHWRFLRDVVGMTDEEIRRAHVHVPAYQLVGRSSVRDLDCNERRRVVVPDRGTADYIEELFSGIDKGRLPDVEFARTSTGRPVGRPKVNASGPMTAAERARRYRARKRERRSRRR
jgi:hypothetical protein